jgi:hypothetical protein
MEIFLKNLKWLKQSEFILSGDIHVVNTWICEENFIKLFCWRVLRFSGIGHTTLWDLFYWQIQSRFNFKSNYCPTLALSSTNKSYIYPIWHTASSNDTTKSYSQWIRTPQHRTLLRQRDKISSGISKRQFSLTSFSYLCKCSPEVLNRYDLNFFHEYRDVHVICTAYVRFPMKSRCRKLT